MTTAPNMPASNSTTVQRFNVAEEFAKACAPDSFSFRAPVSAPEDWIGPLLGRGDCLAPLLQPGDIHWFDPKLEPRDGDFVLVHGDPEELAGIWERAKRRGSEYWAWFSEIYGQEPKPGGNLMTKWLRHFGTEMPTDSPETMERYKRGGVKGLLPCRWLVTRESMFRVGKNRILGVLVRNERPAHGASLDCGEPVHAIVPDAATEVFTTTDASETLNASVGADGGTAIYVTFTPPVDCNLLVTASFRGFAVTGAAGGFTARARTFRSLSDGSSQSNGPEISIGGAEKDIVVHGLFAATGGTTYRAGMNAFLTVLANPGSMTLTDINVKVELIKR